MKKTFWRNLKKSANCYKIKYLFSHDHFKIDLIDYPKGLPVLLSGQVQRSGGTVFARFFDGHPQVMAHPGEIIFLKKTYKTYNDKELFLGIDRLIQNSKNGYTKGKNVGDIRLPFAFCGEKFFKDFISQKFQSKKNMIDFYFDNFFKYWLDCNDFNITADKKKLITGFAPNALKGSLVSFMEENPRINFFT